MSNKRFVAPMQSSRWGVLLPSDFIKKTKYEEQSTYKKIENFLVAMLRTKGHYNTTKQTLAYQFPVAY